MRSPYMWLVEILADFVNGEYPAHFDAQVKRKVRAILWTTTIAFTAAWVIVPREYLFGPGIIPSTGPEALTLIIFLSAPFLFSRAAVLRRQSLEKHALQSSYQDIASGSTESAVVEDAILLYDYLKVFFVLFLLVTVVQIPYLVSSHPIFQLVRAATTPYQLYYMLIILVGAIIIGGRWTRRTLNSSSNETNNTSTDTSSE